MASSGPRLILASQSPRRRALLRRHGYRFSVRPSHVSEKAPASLGPSSLVRTLASRKALAVARRYPSDIVIGSDTLVFLDRRVIGKPRDAAHARRMLASLSGRWQRVCTGVAVAWEGGRRKQASSATSWVLFRRLTFAEIEKAAGRHLDKAGAYAVQQKGGGFVRKIRGDYDNVVGFPMRLVTRLLRRAAGKKTLQRFRRRTHA